MPEFEVEGRKAYAMRQAALQRALRASFEREWEKLPAFIADARLRAGQLDMAPESEGRAADAFEDGDGDIPVPLGPPGALLIAEVDG
jgi:hypothetical protein